MSPNISKPSATLVPFFSKIYSPPSRPLPFFPLFIPLPRIFTPSSFGIAKVLPFLIPTKCFRNFFLSLHATRCLTLRNFLPSSPPHSPFLSVPSNPSDNSIPLQKGFYGYIRFLWVIWCSYSMNSYQINCWNHSPQFRKASFNSLYYIYVIWLLELSRLMQGRQIVLLSPSIYLFLSFMIPLSSSTAHRSTYGLLYDRKAVSFVSSFHTFQRIGKYSHKLTHFSYFMHSLQKNTLSYLSFISSSPPLQ